MRHHLIVGTKGARILRWRGDGRAMRRLVPNMHVRSFASGDWRKGRGKGRGLTMCMKKSRTIRNRKRQRITEHYRKDRSRCGSVGTRNWRGTIFAFDLLRRLLEIKSKSNNFVVYVNQFTAPPPTRLSFRTTKWES